MSDASNQAPHRRTCRRVAAGERGTRDCRPGRNRRCHRSQQDEPPGPNGDHRGHGRGRPGRLSWRLSAPRWISARPRPLAPHALAPRVTRGLDAGRIEPWACSPTRRRRPAVRPRRRAFRVGSVVVLLIQSFETYSAYRDHSNGSLYGREWRDVGDQLLSALDAVATESPDLIDVSKNGFPYDGDPRLHR
jgi:hypothetical protein